MRHVIWVFLALLVVSVANAGDGTFGYEPVIEDMIKDYLAKVNKNAPDEGARQCERLYTRALKKGVLDIRYALGYFDVSKGVDQIVDGKNYGLSPSLDIEIFKGLRRQLKSRCWSFNKRLCGFDEAGDPGNGKAVFTRKMDLHGQKILVRLTLTQASASPYFQKNKGELASRQAFLTRQSEQNFFGGLQTADIVFYNGHSRNGGGPDFAPPILNSSNKVNYRGYYRVKRPGILKTLAALKATRNPGVIVGFFSCFSRLHFYKTFMQNNPHQRLILSAERINYYDTLQGSIGYLEGMLRGSCGDELSHIAEQNEKLQGGFQSYNLQ